MDFLNSTDEGTPDSPSTFSNSQKRASPFETEFPTGNAAKRTAGPENWTRDEEAGSSPTRLLEAYEPHYRLGDGFMVTDEEAGGLPTCFPQAHDPYYPLGDGFMVTDDEAGGSPTRFLQAYEPLYPLENVSTMTLDIRQAAQASSDTIMGGSHVEPLAVVKNEDDSLGGPVPIPGPNTGVEDGGDYDTCFGVVIVDVSLPTTDHRDIADSSVTFHPNGGILCLSFEDSGEFAGIIDSSALRNILDRHATRLVATLRLEPFHEKERGKKSKSSATSDAKWRVKNATVRITVYGRMEDKDAIADLLSDEALFFQHPTSEECDPGMPYFNPHFLLRPGAEMPKIEELSISESRSASEKSVVLDEVNQGRIWRIFDLANSVGASTSVAASRRLKSELRDHQLQALAMMVERECGVIEGARFPSLWQGPSDPQKPNYRHIIAGTFEKKPGLLRGGVLADEMGLGKTLTTLALICWYLDVRASAEHSVGSPGGSSSTMIVVPKSIIIGWESQITRHINLDMITAITYHGPSRRNLVPDLLRHDIVLTTYETLRDDYMASKTPGAQTLYSHNWHRVVLDEAHRIRTRSSKLHQSVLAISKRTHCRWCLTGTPIHNSLDDYGALLSFLQAPKLSDKRAFDKLVAKPVKDKNQQQKALARLQDLVRATCLRRTISGLGAASLHLPPPEDKIERLGLGHDEELYTFFKRKTASIASGLGKRRVKNAKGSAGAGHGDENILSLLTFLRLICNYGERMLPKNALEAWREKDSSSIDWWAMEMLHHGCAGCGDRVRKINDGNLLLCGHHVCGKCQRRVEEVDEGDMNEVGACLACRDLDQIEEAESIVGPSRSAKVQSLIRNILGQQSDPGTSSSQKCVVFSCWTKMLRLVQRDLQSIGLGVQRIDGRASLQQRRAAMKQFSSDPGCTVMLASIGSAGEGIDLISACHVHILEPQWNPMTESQAIGRVHRMGQTQRVTVTRYIVDYTVETYVQWIQKDKLSLISQSLDSRDISQEEVDQKRRKELNYILSEDCQDGRCRV